MQVYFNERETIRIEVLISFNEKLVVAATNYIREKLKIDKNIWVFINDGKNFESDKHSGKFEKEVGVIRYNKDFLETATEEQILKLAFHETFHAFQFQEVFNYSQGIKSKVFSDEELKTLEHEFNLNTKTEDTNKWHELLLEQQAETFAHFMCEKYKEFFSGAVELIEKYLDMFPNLEQINKKLI